jgi:[ribosomal protein S5]-alanine N-acetyltransferase
MRTTLVNSRHGEEIHAPPDTLDRFINCTPSYYRFWAVTDAKTDRCFGMVNYHDGHIRHKRVAIGYIIDPALPEGHRGRGGLGDARFLLQRTPFASRAGLHHPDNIASRKLAENLGSAAKAYCAAISVCYRGDRG